MSTACDRPLPTACDRPLSTRTQSLGIFMYVQQIVGTWKGLRVMCKLFGNHVVNGHLGSPERMLHCRSDTRQYEETPREAQSNPQAYLPLWTLSTEPHPPNRSLLQPNTTLFILISRRAAAHMMHGSHVTNLSRNSITKQGRYTTGMRENAVLGCFLFSHRCNSRIVIATVHSNQPPQIQEFTISWQNLPRERAGSPPGERFNDGDRLIFRMKSLSLGGTSRHVCQVPMNSTSEDRPTRQHISGQPCLLYLSCTVHTVTLIFCV